MASVNLTTALKSTQAAKFFDSTSRMLDTKDIDGRVRVARFNYTAAANVAHGTVILLTKLPAGAKLLQLRALSDGNTANSDVKYGLVPTKVPVDDDIAALKAATDNASGSAVFEHLDVELDEESWVTVQPINDGATGTALASGKVVNGYVLYVTV